MSQKKAASKKTARKRVRAARKAPPPATVIPVDNQLTLAEFMRHLLDGHTFAASGRKRPFCFILGAGASIQSGIPAARTLVDEWLRDLHSLASTTLKLEDWATEKNLKIAGFEYARRSEFYSNIFDLRFKGHEEDGTLYLQEKMKNAQPSYGYAVLAQLLSDVHRVVITTNFDSLASDAMFLFGGEAPFICGHERMADYIPEHSRRPVIVKIHRDLLTAPINSSQGTSKLEAAWHAPVERLLQRFIPIFIGYGGNDGSLMQFLASLPEDTPERLYWCHYKHDLPSLSVINYLQKENRYLVPIDGFDQLMQEVHRVLALPNLIEKLEEKNKARVASLRESQAKLTATTQADKEEVEKSKGKDSPDALEARFKYANALYEQGRYAEAEKEHRAVWRLRKRVLGAEHPDTLRSKMNLANALLGLGKHAKAEQVYREVWGLRERVLGAQHHYTLRSRNSLASALAEQGKYAEAEQEYRAVSTLMERVLGAEHPETLGCRMNLAVTLNALGKPSEAEQEYRAVFSLQERSLGTEHPDLAKSFYNLALCLKAQHKFPEALQYMQRAEQLWLKVLGPDHPDTQDATAARQRIEAALKKDPPPQ